MAPLARQARAASAVAAFAAVLLGGCLAGPAPADAQAMGLAQQPLSWNGCDGARVNLSGLSSHYPSSAPEGWEPDPVAPGASLRVTVLRCDRVAWGGLERGPVFLLQEWRDDFRAPESCWTGDHDERFLLESIWFSDEGLARHAAALGLPAHAATFGVRGSSGMEEWTWATGEGPEAAITLPTAGGSDLTKHDQARLFWADGGGVARMDVRLTTTQDNLRSGAAWGTLPAPMLHGRAGPSPAFVSPSAARLGAVDGVADLHRFRDRSCGQPL